MTTSSTLFISDTDHYKLVIEKVKTVKQSLWIGTADVKDLYVKQGVKAVPFLEILSELIKKGVDVRLIHAKEPGPNFRKDFDKYPLLFKGLKRALCPRVHFKLIIFDLETVYIGSANLTGAGMGMKGEHLRNFEVGVLTTDLNLVDHAIGQFDKVWTGSFCQACKRKAFCIDSIK